MKTLYALIFKESGEIVTPESFKKYWKNYGDADGWLQGWRPPKKVYYTVGHAKSGFAHIPSEIKPLVSIAEFSFSKILDDGDSLIKSSKLRKIKLQISKLNRRLTDLQDNQDTNKSLISKIKSDIAELKKPI
jgi:hypothetical protein